MSKGKQVEAVYFAHAAGLFEKFPPVPLLKAYLKNSKKATLATLKSGNNSAAVVFSLALIFCNCITMSNYLYGIHIRI